MLSAFFPNFSFKAGNPKLKTKTVMATKYYVYNRLMTGRFSAERRHDHLKSSVSLDIGVDQSFLLTTHTRAYR